MANKTQANRRPATSSRFSRPGGTTGRSAPGRSASARRPTAPSRRPTIRRRPQQKTGMAKLAESVTGMLPGTAAAKKSGGGGKGRTAGLALLAGAAGLALKNRDKLPGMGRKGSGTGDRTAHADAPANPVVVDRQPDGTPPPAA